MSDSFHTVFFDSAWRPIAEISLTPKFDDVRVAEAYEQYRNDIAAGEFCDPFVPELHTFYSYRKGVSSGALEELSIMQRRSVAYVATDDGLIAETFQVNRRNGKRGKNVADLSLRPLLRDF